MGVDQRQPSGRALHRQHEFLGLRERHGIARIGFIRLEIESHERRRPRLAGRQEGGGLLLPRILAGAEMVATPQQPGRLGLAPPRTVRGIEPVATFGHLVKDSEDVAASYRGKVRDGDVVADVDHRIQPGLRMPGRRGGVVEAGARGRISTATSQGGRSQTSQAPQQISTRDHSINNCTERGGNHQKTTGCRRSRSCPE